MKNYFKITNGLILFLFAFFLLQLLVNNCIFDIDDLNSTFDSYPLWKEENGRFVCNFLSRIFCLHIPNLLEIHLQNWANTVGAFFYLLIVLSLIFAITRFSFLFDDKKNLNPALLAIPVLLFTEYLIFYTPNYNLIVSFQYGYVLAATFGILFLYYLFEKFVFDKKLKYLFLYSLLGFCAGNSTQAINYSIFVTTILFLIYKYISLKKNKQDFKAFISDKFVYLPIIMFFSGLFIMVVCPGFWNEVAWRHADSITQVFQIIVPFFKDLIRVFLLQKFYLSAIIFLFIFNNILLYKKNQIEDIFKKLIPSLFPLIGIFCYFCMTILGGDKFIENNHFWISESFYTFCYKMILAVILVYLLSFSVSLLSNKTVKNIFPFILLFLIMFFNNNDYKIFKLVSGGWWSEYKTFSERYIDKIEELKSLRKNMYISDNIALYELSKGIKIIKLPYAYNNPPRNLNIYNSYKRYYKRVYNKDFSGIDDVQFIPEKEAIEYYYSLGGTEITSKELIYTDFNAIKRKFQ